MISCSVTKNLIIMKKGIISSICLLLLGLGVFAQDSTVYYNSAHSIVSRDSADYMVHFVRGVDGLYSVERRRVKNNDLLSKGYCVTLDSPSFTGHYTAYSDSGMIVEEGTFVNNKKQGVWKYYYENTKQMWYNVDMVEDREDGTLKSFYRNGKLKRIEQLDKGMTISGNCYDKEGNDIKFTPFMQMPYPEYSILQYLANNLNYPSAARKNRIEGRVKVNFIVDEKGKLTHFKIVKSLGHGCDEEVLRVMHLMPKWVPGTKDDEPIKVFYTQPVSFKLQ